MTRLGVEDIISKIEREECFEAIASDYSFTLKIEKYVPFVCGAVHDGNQFRKSLWDKCLHSAYDRWYEEDPSTKEMVQSYSIVIAGCDSRFEYDLNRAPETAIYDDAWGKKLWKEPLTTTERQLSLEKHASFYKVVNALMKKLESKFSQCIVYDMHSYNWKRWDREVPTWNLGTKNVDQKRYAEAIEAWRQSLSEIKLPHKIISDARINDTFQGNGYFLKYITEHTNNTLVLATEVKKIYCDELKQIVFPEVVKSIEAELKKRIQEHAAAYCKV